VRDGSAEGGALENQKDEGRGMKYYMCASNSDLQRYTDMKQMWTVFQDSVRIFDSAEARESYKRK